MCLRSRLCVVASEASKGLGCRYVVLRRSASARVLLSVVVESFDVVAHLNASTTRKTKPRCYQQKNICSCKSVSPLASSRTSLLQSLHDRAVELDLVLYFCDIPEHIESNVDLQRSHRERPQIRKFPRSSTFRGIPRRKLSNVTGQLQTKT